MWRKVETGNIRSSWAAQIPRLATVVAGAQLLAGQTADQYIATVLEQQDVDNARQGQIEPAGLVGVASDGRPLDTLLYQPAVTTVTAISEGAVMEAALAQGLAALLTIVATQVEDAFRVAGTIAGTTRGVQMYARALSPPSCDRCAILAGTLSSWQTAFRRHPRCDCISVPTNRARGEDLVTDPNAYFKSLSRAEQDKVFTIAGAEAIRDGADITKVVNVRRRTAGIGTTLTNRPGRLMPEAIYGIARDREHALQLLAENGYIREDWRARLIRVRGFA